MGKDPTITPVNTARPLYEVSLPDDRGIEDVIHDAIRDVAAAIGIRSTEQPAAFSDPADCINGKHSV